MAKYYYQLEIRHDGLNEYKVVKGTTQYEAQQKAQMQLQKWEEAWRKKIEVEQKEKEKQRQKELLELNSLKADKLSEEAQEKLNFLKNILVDSLKFKPFAWDNLKSNADFLESKPDKKLPHSKKEIDDIPKQEDFAPKFGVMDKMIKSKMENKKKEAEEKYLKAVEEYNSKVNENNFAEQKYSEELSKWESRKKDFYDSQDKKNLIIDLKKEKYESEAIDIINEYIASIINNSYFPLDFTKEFKLYFNIENKILIIDFLLPEPDKLPRLKEVKYNKIKDIFIESFITDIENKNNYDNFIYQLALKFLNDIFKSDYKNIVESIVFNGWINTIDAKTGKDITLCIISVQTSKPAFEEINLEKIDPKECFKGLKGVSSAKLHTITPIAPILQLDKTDKRFISSYEVMGKIDDSENIAAMDWEDFEHLIREIFEKEFSVNGGEVKVTQSSRDGGVDAIAFDPDPIRGGKIVIQAKRYTNVVGVSAVRDLFGTVMNEGATKGILVTTADYGADSYEFAKGKPLTLLNGSNLLHLLEKHGHKAKIDLKEAKLLLEENKK